MMMMMMIAKASVRRMRCER